MIKMFLINLQLFAEGEEDNDFEELEDGGYVGLDEPEDDDPEDNLDVEHEDNPADEPEDDLDDEHEEEEVEKPAKDKKTQAIINAKREAKEAKEKARQLEARLAAIEAEKEVAAREKASKAEVDRLIEEGYGEKQAKAIVSQQNELEMIKLDMQKLKLQGMEGQYPGISRHADEIIATHRKANGALSIEEIYLAKFSKLTDKDIKNKTE